MIVEQIWTGNSGRNFNYLIACGETGEALAVDPLDHEKCLAAAKAKGWTITQILNTHHHRDHTGGNDQVIAATGAKLLAHANARDQIAGIDRGLKAGDVIKVGRTVELEWQETNRALVTTLGLEKEINTCVRLSNPSVIRRLREAFPDLPEHPDQKTVFLKLRELRNKW